MDYSGRSTGSSASNGGLPSHSQTAYPSKPAYMQQQQQHEQLQQGYNQMQMQQQMRIQNQMQPPPMQQGVGKSFPNSLLNNSMNNATNPAPSNTPASFPSQAAKPADTSATVLPTKLVGASKSASHASAAPAPALPVEEIQKLLKECDWVDKTIWSARQIFGGQALNGFLRSTATVQRVKKQKARQTAPAPDDASAKREAEGSSLAAEETLKKEIMNARTAKKLKTELESGMEFCEFMHETIRDIIKEINPMFVPPPPLGKELPGQRANNMAVPGFGAVVPTSSMSQNVPLPGQMLATAAMEKTGQQLPPSSPMQSKASNMAHSNDTPPSYANGSSLRKLRKKKLPPNSEPTPKLSEFDETGKKRYPKKELLHRISHIIRYRPLREGDLVAARPSSRDLWILAKVLKNYPGFSMAPEDFLQLSEAKKDNLFREKVLIKDVEEKHDGSSVLVDRKLILPLPRNFSEAADWGQRVKKGSRVYAMYPQTTSLYPATVVDNSTYCRDDDDIIVVEFDGDEPDTTGMIPKCHIPARFVTIIPREFAASHPPSGNTKKKGGPSDGSQSQSNVVQSAAAAMLDSDAFGNLDDMAFDDVLPALDGFDDLDFDLFEG